MARAKLSVGLAILVLLALMPPTAAAALPPGGTFLDDDGTVHEGSIEAIAVAGITVGCDESGERFCPDRSVTRAEMATFLVRAFGLNPQEPVRFTDAAGVHRQSIGAVEAAGWFKGCNPPENDRFCPEDVMTRGQVAAVLVRALDLPVGSGPEFVDDDGSVFEDAIEALAAAGIAHGCNPPANDRFCPGRSMTRAEMATFLTRALDLEATTPAEPFAGRMVFGLWNALIYNGGIATMEGTRIPQTLLLDSVGDPVLSPDADTVAYFDFRRACPPDAEGPWDCYERIFTIPFTGGAERQMTQNSTDPGGYGWLPDSDAIGFIDHRDNGAERFSVDWYLAKVEVSNPLVVEDIAGPSAWALAGPDWSPNGDIVVMAQQDMGDVMLLILDADGNEQSLIAAADRDLVLPQWSPDGTKLAYVAHSLDDEQLVVSGPDGSDRRVVATLPDINDLAWSPDGSTLAYVSSERAWAIPVSGGSPWPLTPSDIPVLELDWGPGRD